MNYVKECFLNIIIFAIYSKQLSGQLKSRESHAQLNDNEEGLDKESMQDEINYVIPLNQECGKCYRTFFKKCNLIRNLTNNRCHNETNETLNNSKCDKCKKMFFLSVLIYFVMFILLAVND